MLVEDLDDRAFGDPQQAIAHEGNCRGREADLAVQHAVLYQQVVGQGPACEPGGQAGHGTLVFRVN